MKKKVFITMLLLSVCLIGCNKTQETADEKLLVEDIENVGASITSGAEKDSISVTPDVLTPVPSMPETPAPSVSEATPSVLETPAPSVSEATSSMSETPAPSVSEATSCVLETTPSVPETPVTDTGVNVPSQDSTVDTVVDFSNTDGFVVGEEIGNSGIIWGGTFDEEFVPTTDGYGDGTIITIEPLQ